MRRALVLLGVLALATCAATARAQAILPYNIQGETRCTPWGVQSVIDMELLDDSTELPGLKAHEKVHQAQLLRNRASCKPSWGELLWMEAEAYCRGTAPEHLKLGQAKHEVYEDLLGRLQWEFSGHLPPERVRNAWSIECGIYLEER